MSKRSRRSPASKRPQRRDTARRRPPRREEPDLVEQIADALDDDDPLSLLGMASTMLAVFDPRTRHPLRPEPDGPTREEFVESFLGVPLPETSALLAAVAALSGDEVLRRRVAREIVDRAHALPRWLADLSRTAPAPEAVEVTHVLGDGDDVLVAVTLPDGHVITAVVFVEHNLGTIVKDAFVVSGSLDEIVASVGEAGGHDPDLVARPLDPADARARITEAIETGARMFPPYETDTWPSSRALVEWMTAMLPEGGTGYERPEWDDDAVADLTRRFRASPFAADLDDPGDLLSSLLWFGTDYGPGDPMRWSPVSVEILLVDWIPRKIVAAVADLAPAPDVLRAFVRFCHAERGIRPALTDETLAAIDAVEPEYQRLIRSDRPQGPAALLAAIGAFDDGDEDDLDGLDATSQDAVIGEIMLDTLRRAVGGEAALYALDANPLPDEPFAWDAVPADVHERVGGVLALVERCCTDLLDDQYRAACRRLLADAAAGDPEIFRRRGRAETAAAAVCWIAGKANALFDPSAGVGGGPPMPTMQVKELAEYFGVAGSGVSQRGGAFLRAIGVDSPTNVLQLDLGTPRYLTGPRRAQILAARDRFRAMVE
jgi:hypothetical protein